MGFAIDQAFAALSQMLGRYFKLQGQFGARLAIAEAELRLYTFRRYPGSLIDRHIVPYMQQSAIRTTASGLEFHRYTQTFASWY